MIIRLKSIFYIDFERSSTIILVLNGGKNDDVSCVLIRLCISVQFTVFTVVQYDPLCIHATSINSRRQERQQ